MPEITRWEPGSFCWAELATTDAEGAKRFYGNLFGGKPNDMPMEDGTSYTTLELRGLPAAALYPMRQDQRDAGMPPNWMPYVSVESADDTVRRARELGGKVHMEPFDVFDFGRMAVLEDPTGAAFSIWQPKAHIGARVYGEPGAFCWNELDTNDTGKAVDFYTKLFDWRAKPSKDYTEFTAAGASYPMGGMMQIPEDWGNIPPYWLVYFAVGDCNAAAKEAEKLGGKTFVPPTDIPNTGRFAVLQDPQGALFAVIKLTMPGGSVS
jgi:predicted enzyme related to lactoylglutathione lyase